MPKYLDKDGLTEYTTKLTAKYKTIFANKTDVGSPLVAATKSAMTDHDKIYVYTGSESGMTAGNWYYWNGTAWTSGGVYNSTAVQTDKTLTVENQSADAKVTGDEIGKLKNDVFNKTLSWNSIPGKFINYANGSEGSNSSYTASDYIDISNCGTITISNGSSGEIANALYDKDKNYVRYFYVLPTATTFVVPPNVYYMRISNTHAAFATTSATYTSKDELALEMFDGNNPELITKYGHFLTHSAGGLMYYPIENGYDINGTATTASFSNVLLKPIPELGVGDTFFVKVSCSDANLVNDVRAGVYLMDSSDNIVTYERARDGVSYFTVVPNTSYVLIRADVNSGTVCNHVKLKIYMYKEYPILDSVDNLNKSLDRWFARDIYPEMIKTHLYPYTDPYTDNGITFTWLNEEKTSLKISGTQSGPVSISYMYMNGYSRGLPSGVVPGQNCYLRFKSNATENAGVYLQVHFYKENASVIIISYQYVTSSIIPIPSDATGMTLRVCVGEGVTAKNSNNEDIVFSDIGFLTYSDSVVFARSEIENYNCKNLLEDWWGLDNQGRITNVVGNMRYHSVGGTTYHVRGYTDGTARFANILNTTLSGRTPPLKYGGTYYFELTGSQKTWLQFYYRLSGSSDFVKGVDCTPSEPKKKFTIPSNTDNYILRLYTAPNVLDVDEVVSVAVYDSLSNQELSERIEDAVRPNEYTFNNYSSTVTLNATPTITTDTNNYLAATGTTADRSADILAMLNATGYCHLGPGVFHVKNIDMPTYSKVEGCGAKTVVYLKSDGQYCFSLGTQCTIANMKLQGGEDSIVPTETVANRHGIIWSGTYSENQNGPKRGTLDNLYIYNFTGGGVTLYNTGYSTSAGIEATNLWIANCSAGINISYWSEYSKFTNVSALGCYYGCINNGGNNVFTNCDFSNSKEIAFLMDNSQNQSPNNSHGSAVGCVFNHTQSGGTSNAGIGLKILNCDNGFTFTGCQFFYSRIEINDSDGVVISNSIFGNSNCSVSVTGGGAVLFANNIVQANLPVSIANNNHVRFTNNYIRSSGEEWHA